MMITRAAGLVSGLCLVALACAASPVRAQMQAVPVPSITVTGEATLSLAPDIAIVRAGVVSQGKTAREAMASNAKTMTAILAALKESGIAEAGIQTSRVSLDAIRNQNRETPHQVTGFQATNRVSVQVRDVGKAGDILDRLVAAGANTISGVDFIVSGATKALDKVRADAVEDARRKAEIYAQAAGVGLGRAIMISEQGAPVRPLARMAAPAAGVPIAPGEEQIGLSVTVTYEIMR